MPNPQERALLDLLQKERQRNGTSAPVAEPMPAFETLDPSMFLSASARLELQAAQQVLTVPGVHVVTTDPVIELDTGWEITDNDFNASTEPSADLESIFMARAIRETGGSRPSSRAATVSYDISFGTSEVDDIDTMRSRLSSRQSVGGEVVSRRGTNGFERVAARPTREALRALEARTPQRAAPVVERAASSPEPKSRYELLLGPSLID